MAVTEIANLATTLLNQVSAQNQNASANTTPAASVHANNANVLPEDRFTPSAQQNSFQTAAQQAGLFQVAQFSGPSVAVNIAQTRTAPREAPQNQLPAQVQTVAVPATGETTPLAVQDKLQTLNTALAALGLSNPDIQSLDRVAAVAKDFNPVAYRSLAFQLQALALLKAPPGETSAPDSTTVTTGGSANGAVAGVQQATQAKAGT